MGSGASRRENSSEKLQEKKSLLKTLSGHTGGINCMDIYDSILLTGSDDRTARLWDLETFECKVVLEGHRGYISCCKLWGENYALTGSFDKSIRKWNCVSGNCVLKMERHTGIVNRLLIHRNLLFSSSYDSLVLCWNLSNGEVCRMYQGHTKSILPIAYVERTDKDSDNDTDNKEGHSDSLITGSMDKTVRIWNVSSGTSLSTFRGHKGAVLCLAVDHENNILFTGSTDNTIRKWNLLTGSSLKVFRGHEGSVICLQMHHRLLYSASVDTTARCWVAEFGDTTRKYVGHDHMVADMKYYHGMVYTGSGDCGVRAFDAKSGNLKKTFKGHKFPVNCLLTHYANLLSGSYDGTVKVWNVKEFVQRQIGDSEMSIGSSLRSSASTVGRRISDSASESDVSIRTDKYLHGKSRSGTKFETTNEIAAAKNRQMRPRKGKVGPVGDRRNRNNNSNHTGDLDCNYITNKLQSLIEDDDYWAGSSNQSSEINSNGTTPNHDFASRNTSAYSSQYSWKTKPKSNDTARLPSNRTATPLHKQNHSRFINKRARTESGLTFMSSGSEVHPDIALVDEELQTMSGIETSPGYSSGYQTADNESPCAIVDKPKSRQKSSVSFSPNIDSHDRDSRSYRSSRIPTSAKSRQLERHESNRSLASSTVPYDSRMSASSHRSKNLEVA